MQRDADVDELRQAYRRRALDAHPDRRADGAPAEAMAAINEAWNVLRDPQRRAEYDRTLDAAVAARPRAATPAPSPPAASPQRGPEDAADAIWVDHTDHLRRFRMLVTAVAVTVGLIFVLVFVFIIWPNSP